MVGIEVLLLGGIVLTLLNKSFDLFASEESKKVGKGANNTENADKSAKGAEKSCTCRYPYQTYKEKESAKAEGYGKNGNGALL